MDKIKEILSRMQPMSKEEMWDKLDGKIIKCITSKDENCKVFAVQDLEDGHVYILDTKQIN